MTDTERELRQLLSEALDVRVVHGVEHALWRVRVKRALAKQEDAAVPETRQLTPWLPTS